MSVIKRRVIAVVSALLAIIILGITCSFVLKYVRTPEYEDADGKIYHILNNDGEYKLYEKGSDTPLAKDEYYNYFVTTCGTLVNIDPTTGEVKDKILVDNINDFVGSEEIGWGSRVLIFPHLERKDILSIEVYNSDGGFTFTRMNEKLEVDPTGDFAIKKSPLTEFSGEKFAELIVGTGYTISTMKIKDPIKNANGEYTEYGLVPEVRERDKIDEETGEVIIDEETGEPVKEKYNYVPAYYIVTEISGKQHKMIVGDPLVTGGGYYVQYVEISGSTETKRDAVYVLGTSVGNTVLATVEDFIAPKINFPLSMSNYYDVEDFILGQRNGNEWKPLKELYSTNISFSYIDISERLNSTDAVVPYKFSYGLEGYKASDTAISNSMYKLYSPDIIGAVKAFPDEQDLLDYGFFTERLDENGDPVLDENGKVKYDVFSKYTISYDYDVLNDTHDGVEQVIHQQILISDKDYAETGNYYVYSLVYNVTEKDGVKTNELMFAYDYITEVSGETFNFLAWDEYDWVNPTYIDQNIAFITDIKVTSSDYSATFKLNNKLSTSSSNGVSSNALFVTGSDSEGRSTTSFGVMDVYDDRGYLWRISSSTFAVYDAKTGKKLEMNKEYTFYDYNDIGVQVYCRDESNPIGSKANVTKIKLNGKEIKGAAGSTVNVTKNYVTVNLPSGDTLSYLRYETELFRRYFQTLLYASLVDSYEMTDEEEAALINDPEKFILSLEMTVQDADKTVTNEETGEKETIPGKITTNVYKFYKISARKAYITVDGQGGFYVYTSRVEKFISDAVKFLEKQIITPTGN